MKCLKFLSYELQCLESILFQVGFSYLFQGCCPRTGLGLEAEKTGLGLGLDGNGLGLETLWPRPRVIRPCGLVYCNVLISCWCS